MLAGRLSLSLTGWGPGWDGRPASLPLGRGVSEGRTRSWWQTAWDSLAAQSKQTNRLYLVQPPGKNVAGTFLKRKWPFEKCGRNVVQRKWHFLEN